MSVYTFCMLVCVSVYSEMHKINEYSSRCFSSTGTVYKSDQYREERRTVSSLTSKKTLICPSEFLTLLFIPSVLTTFCGAGRGEADERGR